MYESVINKHYIVIGANSGIGLQLSKELIHTNCKLLLVDRNTDKIAELSSNNHSVSFLKIDLSSPENVTQIFEYLKNKNETTDGMVYCAGICPLLTLRDFDISIAYNVYNINLISFIATCKYFLDERYTNANSSIVAISSNAAQIGGNRQYFYSSSKAALNIAVKSCAKELSERGTRINTVMPSTTNTQMVEDLRTKSNAIDLNIKSKMPFGILEPIDVCNAILFLLSDKSKGISGTAIKVNNGEAY